MPSIGGLVDPEKAAGMAVSATSRTTGARGPVMRHEPGGTSSWRRCTR